MLRFARVEHLPASVEVELLFLLVESVSVFGCLRDEDFLGLFNARLAQEFTDLIVWIDLTKDEDLSLGQHIFLLYVTSEQNDLEIASRIDNRLEVLELVSILIRPIQLCSRNFLQQLT